MKFNTWQLYHIQRGLYKIHSTAYTQHTAQYPIHTQIHSAVTNIHTDTQRSNQYTQIHSAVTNTHRYTAPQGYSMQRQSIVNTKPGVYRGPFDIRVGHRGAGARAGAACLKKYNLCTAHKQSAN